MRHAPRQYHAHRCPRCSMMTTSKDYCPPCLKTIRQPPMARPASFRPDANEFRWKGKSL